MRHIASREDESERMDDNWDNVVEAECGFCGKFVASACVSIVSGKYLHFKCTDSRRHAQGYAPCCCASHL